MKKRFLALLLGLCVLSGASTCVYANSPTMLPPIVSSVEEGLEQELTEFRVPMTKENSNTRYLGGYYEYKNVRTVTDRGVDVGYHPSFKEFKYADQYFFSTGKTTSWSVYLGYNFSTTISASAALSSSSSSGYTLSANGSRKSRPYVVADIQRKVADMYTYDDFNNLLNVVRNTTISSKSISSVIKIRYQ